MSIVTKTLCIHHIPRTAGMWIRKALEDNDIPYNLCHSPQARWRYIDQLTIRGVADLHHKPAGTDLNRVAIFRSPSAWYRSLWSLRVHNAGNQIKGWNAVRDLDRRVARNDFESFANLMIRQYPEGFYTQLIREYASVTDEWWRIDDVKPKISEHFAPVSYPDFQNASEKPKISSELRYRIEDHEARAYEYVR